ncbi:dTMP kinase [Aristophania vespae]|uniref:dTMP kinase n=1 Tax=Aristophania vespae TaxID=2697033 RepID=UPI0023514AE1|nr:dTMP kinase [Aristophania vespae]UMM64057.1 Thymidylate kinase [Aristophania vespae]
MPSQPKIRYGHLIALVGCDGSGKSSLSADLVRILGRNRKTVYGYLGLGSGDLGRRIGQWPLLGPLLEKKLTSKAKKTRTKGEKIPGFITALVVFIFSLIRLKRFRRVKKAVEKGYLVITDRYPQAEIAGQCDGPGLSAARTNNPFIRAMASIEKRLYLKMAAFKPDLIIFLEVDAQTAHQRKPDHDIEALQTKIDIMPHITFNGAPKKIIDASQPYDKVKQNVIAKLSAAKFL